MVHVFNTILRSGDFRIATFFTREPGSSVGIAAGYGLDGPGIESRWGARISATVQTGPGAHSASCAVGTVSFPGVKNDRGVTLTPHPLLVPWSRKGRALPLLPLWAVRPVQSLSACKRVTFTFTFYTRALHTHTHTRIIRQLQGGSNMTGTDLCVNKPHCAAAVRP